MFRGLLDLTCQHANKVSNFCHWAFFFFLFLFGLLCLVGALLSHYKMISLKLLLCMCTYIFQEASATAGFTWSLLKALGVSHQSPYFLLYFRSPHAPVTSQSLTIYAIHTDHFINSLQFVKLTYDYSSNSVLKKCQKHFT